MRARTNFALDPQAEEGLAVPYYTKALEMMLPDVEKRKMTFWSAIVILDFIIWAKTM